MQSWACMLIGTIALTTSLPEVPATLPFKFDDFAHARAEANRRKLPIFVDVWAPW